MKLKQDANKLEAMNKDMYNNITRIESTYVKKIVSWYAHHILYQYFIYFINDNWRRYTYLDQMLKRRE